MKAEETIYVCARPSRARLVRSETQGKGLRLAREASENEQLAVSTRRYRDTVNFLNWKERATEQTTTCSTPGGSSSRAIRPMPTDFLRRGQ